MADMKVCNKCGQEKDISEFYLYKGKYLRQSCKPCDRKYSIDWYNKNKERNRTTNRAWKEKNRTAYNEYMRSYVEKNKEHIYKVQSDKNRKIREDALRIYGGKCECCGEDRIEFLQIDHLNGSGTKHRKEIKISIYYWLKQNGYPKEGFRLLCANCNWSIGMWGYCPHVTIKAVSNG